MSMITYIMLISNHFQIQTSMLCDFFFINFSTETNALLNFFQKFAHVYNKKTHKLHVMIWMKAHWISFLLKTQKNTLCQQPILCNLIIFICNILLVTY